jgi:hypothetical protein
MENPSVSKYTTAFGLSLALTSVLNALLVVCKEKSPALQAEMKRLTGHHWITHVAFILICFVAFGLWFARDKGDRGLALPVSRLIQTILAGVVAAGLIIVGFYLLAD